MPSNDGFVHDEVTIATTDHDGEVVFRKAARLENESIQEQPNQNQNGKSVRKRSVEVGTSTTQIIIE